MTVDVVAACAVPLPSGVQASVVTVSDPQGGYHTYLEINSSVRVESYSCRQDAEEGHRRWVDAFMFGIGVHV
jgi:hypothetical protein